MSFFQCMFAHSLRKFSVRDWSIEQKWMQLLLPLLLLYNSKCLFATMSWSRGQERLDTPSLRKGIQNVLLHLSSSNSPGGLPLLLHVTVNKVFFSDPLFPLTFLVDSWIPGMFDAVFQASFLGTLLLFWLCLYHGVRQVWFHRIPFWNATKPFVQICNSGSYSINATTSKINIKMVKKKKQENANHSELFRWTLLTWLPEQTKIRHVLLAKDVHRGNDVVLRGGVGFLARVQRIAGSDVFLQAGCREFPGKLNLDGWLKEIFEFRKFPFIFVLFDLFHRLILFCVFRASRYFSS